MSIKFEGKKFNIDMEQTQHYYCQQSLCDCPGCRNFYIQIEKKYPCLSTLLQQFGVDISKPDELGWGDLSDGTLDYHFVSYTVNGSIIESDKYEIDMQDNTFVSIVAETGYIPNHQKDKNYFILTVYGIRLPYILNEPLITEQKPRKKLFDFLKKKCYPIEKRKVIPCQRQKK